MQYKDIRVEFLLNKITNKDNLFKGDFTIDPYQNCEFGCKYCDSSFDDIVYIKTNAAEILNKEIKKTKKGTIIVGSVHDPYQKTEKKLNLTRDILDIIQKNGFSCHVLTKSDLVLRDADILSNIDKCEVTLSLSTLRHHEVFEKEVISPIDRLKTIEKLNENGIKTGLAIIPVIPYLTENEFEAVLSLAAKNKAQYILHKHLELKGDQKTCFIDILKEFYPDLVKKYEKLYENSYFPKKTYILKINNKIEKLCKKYGIKNRI